MSGVQIIKQFHRNSFFGTSLLNNLWTIATIQRQITTEAQHRKKPKCLYVQGPIQWVKCKAKFQYLKFGWDWEFSEKQFKEETKQVKKQFKLLHTWLSNCFVIKLFTLSKTQKLSIKSFIFVILYFRQLLR